jgi:hypothetical protein
LKNEPYTNQNKDNAVSDLINLKKRQYAEIKIDKKKHAQEDIPMHGQVIEPPNTKDIPCAAIKSHLCRRRPSKKDKLEKTISQLKKMWQNKSLAKLQSDTLRRQELFFFSL